MRDLLDMHLPARARVPLKLLAAAILLAILLVRADSAVDFVYTGF